MTTGVYKLTNKINGKSYIGGSIDVNRRRMEHFKPSRVSRLIHLPLYEAINKFGREQFEFEILEETNAEDLNAREEYYIKAYDIVKNGYNVSATAFSMHDEDLIKEHSQKLSIKNKNNWQNPKYRKKMTKIIQKSASKRAEIISEYNKIRWADPEHREKMLEQLRKNRVKIAENPENLLKAVKGLKKYTNSIKLPVGQYDKEGNLIATFEGIREAERAMGLPNDTIGKVCRGVKYRKTAAGFIWKYLDK